MKIETYDWILSQANERMAAMEQARNSHPIARYFSAILSSPSPEKPARQAVIDVFDGISTGSVNGSMVRGEIEWEGVDLWPDAHPDDNGVASLKIIYAQRTPPDMLLHQSDWKEWVQHATDNLGTRRSLLVTEITPDDSLLDILTLEADGILYAIDWVGMWRDEEPRPWRIDVLVHLPSAASLDEKRRRLAISQEVFRRYIALDQESELRRERKAELKVMALSLTVGDRVEHDTFGCGTVQSTSGSGTQAEAIIDFGDEHGVKHLGVAYAPLKKLRSIHP